MIITLLAHHIEWDTDGDIDAARSLPSKLEVKIDLSEIEDWHNTNQQICKQLSDATGWCVVDYKLEGYSAEAAFALEISNAQQQNEAEEEVSAEDEWQPLRDKWLAISKRAREEVENRFK